MKVVNRANAAPLGEKWHRSDPKSQNLLFVSIGDGVGAGIIQNGHLLTGASGYFREVEVMLSSLGRLASCVGASAYVLST